MRKKPQKAFTLAELLIALGILGVIATFTIPKVLQSQTDARFKVSAKEAVGVVSTALNQVQLRDGLSAIPPQA